jgi:hypothetical protein
LCDNIIPTLFWSEHLNINCTLETPDLNSVDFKRCTTQSKSVETWFEAFMEGSSKTLSVWSNISHAMGRRVRKK